MRRSSIKKKLKKEFGVRTWYMRPSKAEKLYEFMKKATPEEIKMWERGNLIPITRKKTIEESIKALDELRGIPVEEEEKKKKVLLAGGGGGASVPSVSSEGLEAIIKIALIGIAVLAVFYFLSSLF